MIAFCLIGLGVILFFFALDEGSGWCFFFSLLATVLGLILLLPHHGPPPKKEPTSEHQVCVDDNHDGVYDECSDAKTEDTPAPEVKAPTEEKPKEEPKPEAKEEKGFDWQAWADNIVRTNQIVSCTPEGTQVYVSGSQDIDEAGLKHGPDSLAVWPRLHKDGKPFTCEEGKDPKEEIKR
jgi:hypothetical protein